MKLKIYKQKNYILYLALGLRVYYAEQSDMILCTVKYSLFKYAHMN